MLETKVFEIRDRATLIVAMATKLLTTDLREYKLIRHAGFSSSGEDVILHNLVSDRGSYDPYKGGSNTMKDAHLYIREHWNELKSGDVIDTEFIRGETSSPKETDLL